MPRNWSLAAGLSAVSRKKVHTENCCFLDLAARPVLLRDVFTGQSRTAIIAARVGRQAGSIDFLGFRQCVARMRQGRLRPGCQAIATRMGRTLGRIKEALRTCPRHCLVEGSALATAGPENWFAVPGSSRWPWRLAPSAPRHRIWRDQFAWMRMGFGDRDVLARGHHPSRAAESISTVYTQGCQEPCVPTSRQGFRARGG